MLVGGCRERVTEVLLMSTQECQAYYTAQPYLTFGQDARTTEPQPRGFIRHKQHVKCPQILQKLNSGRALDIVNFSRERPNPQTHEIRTPVSRRLSVVKIWSDNHYTTLV